MDKIKIVLIDSHELTRRQIAKVLNREPGFNVVCEADNSMEGYVAAYAKRPDIVLIDPIMPDGFGLKVVRRIARELPTIRQVVLIAIIDIATEIELRNLGVQRILTKDIRAKTLVKVLREVVHVQLNAKSLEPDTGHSF